MTKIPNSVIGAVSSVLAEYYYSHTKLNSLFMEAGAPGDIPLGNCEIKCAAWLRRCNEDPSVDALKILGFIVQFEIPTPRSPPRARSSKPSASTASKHWGRSCRHNNP